MELNEHGFMEELIAARRETWTTDLCNNGVYDLSFQNQWSFSFLDETQVFPSPNPPSFLEPISQPSMSFNEQLPFLEGLFAQEDNYPPSIIDYPETKNGFCKMETEEINRDINLQVLDKSKIKGNKGKVKKLQGQPSKNLMAERRRRKRLNDRLSMLRSIVPKITKMDRTSILADAIDYMKELLGRINRLQEEETENATNKTKLIQGLRQLKANEMRVRNSHKFEVERRESNTWIDLCCAAKPSLLFSTITTLEALGLEIQHCIISCFHDFSFQASCSETDGQRELRSFEDLKEALLRSVEFEASRSNWQK